MVEKLAKKIRAGEATENDFKRISNALAKAPYRRKCFLCNKGVLEQDPKKEASFTCNKCKEQVTGERAIALLHSRVENRRALLDHVKAHINGEEE